MNIYKKLCPEIMHKYDLSVLKRRLLFFSFIYQSQTNQITLKKIFSQSTRFVLGFWYLTWFVKLSFITGMERKYICIKSLFFTSTHTAKVLEKDKTCILYSGMRYVNLALTCVSGIFPCDQR